jgi:hypothetical protein
MWLRGLLLAAVAASAGAFSPVLPFAGLQLAVPTSSRNVAAVGPTMQRIGSAGAVRQGSMGGKQGSIGKQGSMGVARGRAYFERLTPEQQEVVLGIEADLTEVFRKYDKNRDGNTFSRVLEGDFMW